MQALTQLFFIILNVIVNHDVVFKLIGLANKRRHWLKAVFVTYPNSEKIASRFAPRWLFGYLKWRPYFLGPFEQGGGWGLKFVISSFPHELSTSDNKSNRRELLDRMEYLRRITGAEKILFGFGIGAALRGDRPKDAQGQLLVSADDAFVAAQAAVLAAQQVRERHGLDGAPVIFLATRSMIERIDKYLKISGGLTAIMINPQERNKPEFVWPTELRDRQVVLISLVKEDNLLTLRGRLGSSWIIVNEAYLKDPDDFVSKLGRPKGIPVYQLCGARGRTFPDPPGIYYGSMPCCQVISPMNMEVVVREIKPS